MHKIFNYSFIVLALCLSLQAILINIPGYTNQWKNRQYLNFEFASIKEDSLNERKQVMPSAIKEWRENIARHFTPYANLSPSELKSEISRL